MIAPSSPGRNIELFLGVKPASPLIRKSYLGFRISDDGSIIREIREIQDPESISEVGLQKSDFRKLSR